MAKPKQTKDPKGGEIEWLPYVEEQSYPVAQSFLNLLFSKERADGIIAGLRSAAVVRFQAQDIFLAARLSPQGVSHSHVDRERKRILKGEAPSPLLLVRDEASGRVVIACGYHRLCAVHGIDEDAWIPCKIT
jgi:hypothetical protein